MSAAALRRKSYDVVVVGAGPAGLAAASVAAGAGLATLVLDENPTPGGQVFRSITATPLKDKALLGDDYWQGETLVTEARASGAEIVQRATVWSLDRDRQVAVSIAGRSQVITAKRVILATGALERPFPIPGWTLPGVMTAGGAQTLLKTSGLVPAGRVVIAGSGPLLWLLAAQIVRAGGSLEAILDTTPRANYLAALPYAASFLASAYVWKGLRLVGEVKRHAPVVRNVTRLAAVGGRRLERVQYETGGREKTLDADVLLLHQGVIPNVNLAMAAGVAHAWSERNACFEPVVDAVGNTSVAGIAMAGDGAGIAGALAAVSRGRIAGAEAVRALAPDRAGGLPDAQVWGQALRRASQGRAFLDLLFRPAKAFRVPADDTIVCRCEEVRAGQVRKAIDIGAVGPNQAKAYLRCGMGPCQGRLCGPTVTEIIADARGKSPADIGYYRLRAPVKPVPLAEIAGLEAEAEPLGQGTG